MRSTFVSIHLNFELDARSPVLRHQGLVEVTREDCIRRDAILRDMRRPRNRDSDTAQVGQVGVLFGRELVEPLVIKWGRGGRVLKTLSASGFAVQ